MRAQREYLDWVPQWEGSIKSWSESFIRKNKWRCDGIFGSDDLIQEAYLVFLKIVDCYPRVIEARHFATLYRRAFQNQMHDRARYQQLKREHHQETSMDVSDFDYGGHVGETTNHGHLLALITSGPPEVRHILHLIACNPEKLRDVSPTDDRENFNGRLRRIFNMSGSFDFVGALRELLAA